MRISARCDYACRALLKLSLHWPNKAHLQVQEISKDQEIPERYLVQILIQLKKLGFVSSSRGKEGGYNLAVPPGEIRIGEVMRNIAGPLLPVAESAGSKESVFTPIWKEVEEVMASVLDKITFEDICEKIKKKNEVIFYHI